MPSQTVMDMFGSRMAFIQFHLEPAEMTEISFRDPPHALPAA